MAASINWQPANLQDNNVKLQPLIISDFESLFKVAADPLIWEQHPAKDRYKKDVFHLYFDGAIAGGTAFLIIDIAAEKIIGCTRYYDYKPNESSIVIGFTFLSRDCWGGLYNKSAKRLLIEYAFKFVDKVYFNIGATNLRSQVAITKIGAVKVKGEKKVVRKKNSKTTDQKLARERMELLYKKCPDNLVYQKQVLHDLYSSYQSFSMANNWRRMITFFKNWESILAFKNKPTYRKLLFCLKMFVMIK